MTIAVLIVNWNGGDLLSRCLQSLSVQRRAPDRVVIVDNASTDGSLDEAVPSLPSATVIRLNENVGFARANNIAAAAAADVDAFALLNPDAFAEPGWLEALASAAERTPTAAAFACQMRLDAAPDLLDGAGDSYHVSGRAWRNAHRRPLSAGPVRDTEVFAPCGAAALYRRPAFEDVGGFDERFFCYFEDVDLGFRLRLRGHRCVYVPNAIVRHVSSALSGYRSNFAVYHGERNAVWTFVKNMPGPMFWLYLPQHVALNLAALFFYPWRRQGRTVWKAKRDALRGLGTALRQRRAIQLNRRTDWRVLRLAMARGIAAPYVGRYTAPTHSGGVAIEPVE
jgi:GT2 family glycosyltransferase